MYKLVSDIKKNRLYVTLSGYLKTDEMKEYTDKLIEEVKKLQPGYDVITDVSEFGVLKQDALDQIQRAQQYFKKTGIRWAVRVEGKSKLTSAQFGRIGKNSDYLAETVATLADAEKFLDSKK